MIDPLRNDYELNIKNIEFEETESNKNIYNFSIELEFQKEIVNQ